MRRLLISASNVTLSLAIALVLFTGIAVSQAAAQTDAGIRCQDSDPDPKVWSCTEVIPCLSLDCCETTIIIKQCACACW